MLGLLAGVIAKAIMPGAERAGIVVTTLLGITGALLGGFLATALGLGDPIDEFFDLSTWVAAIGGRADHHLHLERDPRAPNRVVS